jgi:hypothetical protein
MVIRLRWFSSGEDGIGFHATDVLHVAEDPFDLQYDEIIEGSRRGRGGYRQWCLRVRTTPLNVGFFEGITTSKNSSMKLESTSDPKCKHEYQAL